ncbi:hypothetical protein BDQ94DRAFT_144682 [Aspergillus welwitschiae]|uniref:Uncharacterized protein n=1 Tax=Aspergillus welwitschiae TaxID=1341132 RepID=A0A3F3Q0T3_9EURO|nr:hypothetical protein BDQ94DRAFT_144682 [Aspergillus welwitschiae]RDH32602.1 hypothetical protein BDQ94DRAFT_144682 [Aspergillus welwitschiae]
MFSGRTVTKFRCGVSTAIQQLPPIPRCSSHYCVTLPSPQASSPPASPGCSSAFQLRDLDASAHTLPGTNRPCFSPFFGACHPLLVEGPVVMLR